MRAAIHQPCYMPWLGLIEKARRCDVFVFMDDAQYTKSYVFNYNEIKTPQGKMRLRVPIRYRFGDTLRDVRINYGTPWAEWHRKALAMNYANADHYGDVMPRIDGVIGRRHGSLAELNEELTLELFSMFGIKAEIARSSGLGIKTKKEQRVIDICKAVGADEYLSGVGARSYQDARHFEDNGIKLEYVEFEPKPYKQMFGGFVPNLSCVDYLMNCGAES